MHAHYYAYTHSEVYLAVSSLGGDEDSFGLESLMDIAHGVNVLHPFGYIFTITQHLLWLQLTPEQTPDTVKPHPHMIHTTSPHSNNLMQAFHNLMQALHNLMQALHNLMQALLNLHA